MYLQGVRGDWRIEEALLPHEATNLCLRQLQALLTLGERTPDFTHSSCAARATAKKQKDKRTLSPIVNDLLKSTPNPLKNRQKTLHKTTPQSAFHTNYKSQNNLQQCP